MISMENISDCHSTVVTAVTKSKNCTKCGDRYRVDDDGFPYCLQCGNREYQITVKETEIKTPLALKGNVQILHFNGGNVQLVGKVIHVETSKSKLTVRGHTTHRISYRIIHCPFCKNTMSHRSSQAIRNSESTRDRYLYFKCKNHHEVKVLSYFRRGLGGWY